MKKLIVYVFCFIMALAAAAEADWPGWSFDWSQRTDGDGNPAGHYAVTPFPITETSTSYAICNDENLAGKTYELGTKVYVDGGYGGGGSDGSWEHPWTAIGDAVENVAEGNNTIVVRGEHDAFDGVYEEGALTLKSGIDDTHRWTIVGYGQERPVISSASAADSTIVAAGAVTYATIQRVKIQDNIYNGVRTSSNDTYINVIDVWLYNNCRWDPSVVNEDGSTGGTRADGNLYFLGSDNCWIYHTTSERSGGHGFKVGDDADDDLVEWSVAKESGWWEGSTVTDRSHTGQGHPTSCDFPNDGVDSDGDTVPDYGDNLTVRYNICATSVFYAVQLRRTPNFVFHHNEVYDSPHFGDVYIAGRNAGISQVIIFSERTYGLFYANLIHSPGTGKSEPMYDPGEGLGGVNAIDLGGNPDAEGDLTVYNNLIYGHDDGASIAATYSEGGFSNIHVYNNSITSGLNDTSWGSGVFTVNSTFWNFGRTFDFVNNIIYLAGAGNCTEWFDHEGDILHEHNVYYHPAGGLGFDTAGLGAGELETDPLWQALPSGEYDAAFAALTETSPAKDSGADLSAVFTSAFNAAIRPQDSGWDIGAYEYAGVGPQDDGAEAVEPRPEGDAPIETGPDGDGAETAADGVMDQDGSDGDGQQEGGDEGCGCSMAV